MTGYPDRYIVLDTETVSARSARKGWDRDQRLRLGVAKIYDPLQSASNIPTYVEFTDSDTLFAAIDRMPDSREPIYIFAHNMGFDIRILGWFRSVSAGRYSLLPSPGAPGAGRYSTPLAAFDATPVVVRFFRPDGQVLILIDTFNWLDVSLSRIGGWIGDAKLPMPDKDQSDDDWFVYCKQDVDVLDRAIRRLWGWCQSNRWPDWDITPASLSARVYRMRYGKRRIVPPSDPDEVGLDRLGYYGGIVDCFRVGRIDRVTYQVDVNGLYPSAMRYNPYPCELAGRKEGARREKWEGQIDPRYCTAEVWIDSPDRPWPLRFRDGVVWVRGRLRTILPGPELDLAVSEGVVRHLGRWASYRTGDLFTRFVDELWEQRLDARRHGDGLVEHASKRMLTSLHGKFGQKGGSWEYIGRINPPGGYSHGKIVGPTIDRDMDYRSLDGHTYIRSLDAERPEGYVPIASWCTSYARVYMDELISLAGRENVLYQCVDSLIVTGDGLGNLQIRGMIDPDRLGAFKIDGQSEWIDIQTVNQIESSNVSKHSGVKRGSPLVAPGLYEVEEWESCSDGLYAGRVDRVATRRGYRRPPTKYVRGRVRDDGTTEPWTIDDWETSPDDRLSLSVGDWAPWRHE